MQGHTDKVVLKISSHPRQLNNGPDQHFPVKLKPWFSKINNTGQPKRKQRTYCYFEDQPSIEVKIYKRFKSGVFICWGKPQITIFKNPGIPDILWHTANKFF